MRIIRSDAGRRLLFLGVLLILAAWAVGGFAVPPEGTIRPDLRVAQLSQPAKTGASFQQPERKIAFEMRDKPWIGEKGSVLEWLSDHAGMPISTSSAKPTGTLTYINPTENGVPKQYTLPEIIDILNDELLKQNMILVRRAKTFTIEPADKTIDPASLPRVAPEELAHYGNTELVSVIFPLTALVADDFVKEVEPMLGPFGKAVSLARANKLIVQDTAANLKRLRDIIKDIEGAEQSQGNQWSHKCVYIRARDAEKNLKELLGDPLQLLRLMQPAQGGRGGQFGGGGPQFGGPQFGGQMNQQPAPASVPKIRMHYISVDETSNTVLVSGPADKIAQAKEILSKIDVPQHKDQKPILVGPPTFKTYNVPGGNADVLAKNLQDIYRNASQIKISAVGPNSIMVYASPGDQFEILEQIQGSKEVTGGPEVIPLTSLDASDTVETLKGMFGDSKTGAPYLKADTAKNAVIVKGTPDQMLEVRVAIKALGDGGPPVPGSTVRMINLDRASAATIAEALERMLPQLLQNPVQVITPGLNENKPPEPQKKSNGQNKLEGSEEQEAQLVDPQQPAAKNNQPAGKGAPIKITAVGNRLIISSDDPKALATAYDLVRLLTQPQQGQGDYETIKLKNANATDAAKAIDEAFNGPKQNTPQQGGPGGGFGGGRGGGFGGFFQQFAAPGASTPANPSANTVRVVAYPPTNTLLVRASPLDMLRIRQLLKNAIDTEDTESKGIIKTWILKPLQFANATEVANVIKDVYREYTNNNPQPTQVGGLPGFAFGGRGGGGGGRFQNQNIDASGNPRGVNLSVGVDDRANRIILNCTESLYQDIQKLVDQLDSGTKDSTRTVKVIPLQGVDPLLVQQAIDAIQGRRTTPTTTQPGLGSGGFGQSPFGGGRGGFGGGGFNPGGFGGGGPGFNPGMNQPGRGGTPGGGGPPGGRSGSGPQSRGPDFFDYRVKDDPQSSIFYDPHPSPTERQQSPASSSQIQLTKFEQQQPPPAVQPAAPASEPIRGPRSPVTAEALEQLGVIVVSGNNAADVEEIIRIIDYIRRLGAGAEVQIQLVPLEYADATSVSNTLTQLFQRVIIGTSGNTSTTRPTTTTTPLGQISQQQAASIVLIPLPRFNAILLGAPKARIADMLAEIKRLDKPSSSHGRAVPFPLKKASASRVATLLINFYNQRYGTETLSLNQIRITSEDSTNTVFVQAAPSDLEEIRGLIERIDNTVSSAVNELRIVPLRNALASDLATLIVQSISQGIVSPTTPTTTLPGGVPGAPTAPGGLGGLPRTTGVPGAPGALPIAPTAAPGVPSAAQTTGTTKTIALHFFPPQPGAPGVEAGVLEDIHITPDVRTNSLILAAQSNTMKLLLALIRELDVPPPARATVKVFPLRRTDASIMATMLQQLFFGTGTATAGGAPGGLGGAGATTSGTAVGPTVAGVPTTQFTLSGGVPEGAPLVELRITVDVRTNSLIIAAGPNELDVIEAIIYRLEEGDVRERMHKIVHLRYASAADVASTLQGFLTNSLNVVKTSGQNTNFTEFERDVVIFAEPISNRLLISAAPNYFSHIMELVEQLDIQAPQVVIQVLIAEVDLTTTEEFGVEVGLQSPVLFSRSIIPATNFGNVGNGGTVNYANTGAGSLVPVGVTVNSSINPAAIQGFNFNNANNFGLPLGNNPVLSPGVVGFQGLNNLGVGRASANGIGGFVFSAASNTFNLLIRALKTQGRIDILSRPQVQTMDNQTAYVNIGQYVPYVTASNITATGLISNSVNYRDVGIIMQVTPRISPDGTVLMRVIPEVSSVAPTTINLGNGQLATQFNVQHFETTVYARDGETVAIGGLITKRDAKTENKIPWLGELPYVGALFRYRTQDKSKTELLVIMTPHIVRCAMDADRILFEESKRMDWVLGDVARTHGTTGMAPVFSPVAPPGGGLLHDPMSSSPWSELPAPSTLLPGPVPSEPSPQTLPAPRTMPPARPTEQRPAPSVPGPMPQSRIYPDPTSALAAAALPSSGDSTGTQQPGTSQPQAGQPFDSGPTAPPEPPKEKRGWSLLPWRR